MNPFRWQFCAALIFGLGCGGETYAPRWEVAFADGFDTGAVSRMRFEVLASGCNGNERLYEAEALAEMPAEAPQGIAGERVVGVRALAVDADCNIIAEQCEEISLPTDETVSLKLSAVEPRVCATCTCSGIPFDGGSDGGSRCGPFGEPALIQGLRTTWGARSGWISDDLLTLYYSARRDEFDTAVNILRTTRASAVEAFEMPSRVEGPSSSFAEVDPFVFRDELQILYSLGGDFVHGERTAVELPFSTSPFQGFGNGDADASPTLTDDELEGFFSSERASGRGGRDVFRVTRNDVTLEWGIPQVLPFCDAGDERNPTVSSDGLTLVYERDQQLLITERRSRDSDFSSGVPVFSASTSLDTKPSLAADGTALLFVSDRGMSPGEGEAFARELWLSVRNCP